jgi:hypothetical protein
MNRTKMLTSTAAVVALMLGAVPAHAQRRSGGHVSGARSAAAPRSAGAAGTRVSRNGATGGAVPRSGVAGPYYRGRVYGGYGFGYALGTPYYAFRPRVSLGFGVWLGYPIGYPYWAFPNPYIYGDPYWYPGYGYPVPAYGYPPNRTYGTAAPSADPNAGATGPSTVTGEPNTVTAEPGAGATAQGQYGGLSFQITPANAAVLVDGVYVGTASQFTPTTQPLTLTPGRHHVEMRAEGYEPMTFDVNVAPGQVLPYQGTMQPR